MSLYIEEIVENDYDEESFGSSYPEMLRTMGDRDAGIRRQYNLAKFEQMLGKARGNDSYSEFDESFEEYDEEIVEDIVSPKLVKKAFLNTNSMGESQSKNSSCSLTKSPPNIPFQREMSRDTDMFKKKLRPTPTSKDREFAHSSYIRNSEIFEQLLLKAHGADGDLDDYEYEEIEDDPGVSSRDVMAFRTIAMSRCSEEDSTIQQSFRNLHKSRQAAMMDLKTTVSSTDVRSCSIPEEPIDEDEEWEEQVIEKWFRRGSLPDDLSAACKELIPVVYKGDDVNVELMMRRTPLEELYKYLKQHLDYKHMKATQNLNRFDQLFASTNNSFYRDLSTHEEEVEVDEDIVAKKSRSNKRKETSLKSNEDKFEELLRKAHGEYSSDSDDGDESYEEEEVDEDDKTKSNLAMFEKMMATYDEDSF
eukprot:scaffold1784_cov116-Cylindrotheca_fusiformis.AAC.2